MKKMMILAIAVAGMAFAACSNSPKQPQQAPQKAEVITDTVFQNKAAGDYKSFDGSKVITLGKDFTVKTQNDKEYYKWELLAPPQGDAAVISLDRKGADKDIQAQAQIDLIEGTLIVNNETYRKK